MASLWKLEDLEIVGYADVRTPDLLPAVVPPVFRVRSEPDSILLPPYSISFDSVVGATAVSRAEAEHLRDQGKLFLFAESDPFPPRPEHELWFHRDGRMIYQPIHEARRTLRQLGAEALERAVTAFRDGRMREAEDAAGEAMLADDRRWEALAVKVAIRRLQGNKGGENVMRKLAAPLVNEAAFTAVVEDYISKETARPRPQARAVADYGPMHNVAIAPVRADAAA